MKRKIGSGDAADVFEVEHCGALRALKRVEIAGRRAKFARESHYSQMLGEIGIAPTVYASWISEQYGYIVMDKLDSVWGKKRGKNVSSVSTKSEQLQLIRCIITMVQNGYLHNDCHLDNIGFIGGTPKLFDCEFVQRFDPVENPHILSLLVAAQLYIVIEHSTFRDIIGTEEQRNYIFDTIQFILQNPRISITELDLETIPRQTTITKAVKKLQKQTVVIKRIKENPIICDNLQLFMLFLYQHVITVTRKGDKEQYYGTDEQPNLFFDIIYSIRQNKANMDNLLNKYIV
jgi:hypothetical protein